MYAPLDEAVGGGAYGDDDVTDEFYWAAMELFITTGNKDYYKDAEKSEYFLDVPTSMTSGESVDGVGSFDWGNTAALGTLSAVLNMGSFEKSDAKKINSSIEKAADYYIDIENSQGYGLPYGQSQISYNDSDTGYIWGSNSVVTDNSIIIAYAYLTTNDSKYLDGVVSGLDYILGRNANDYSYVTGYGTHAVEYPHHRYWAWLIDDSFPKAPCGVMCGGPNSGMEDPWVRGSGWKKGKIAPQKCYLDHIEAWCVNECTINWNSSLAWIVGFTAQENGGIVIGNTGRSEGFENDGGNGKSNISSSYDEVEDTEKKSEISDGKGNSQNDKISENENTRQEKPQESEKISASENSGLVKMGIIALAAITAFISLLVFIYKMTKLKYDNKK